jgi:hypothetical protein
MFHLTNAKTYCILSPTTTFNERSNNRPVSGPTGDAGDLITIVFRSSWGKESTMRLTLLLIVALTATTTTFAQTNDSWSERNEGEWDQFRLTEYDQEVIDGIKEFQSLIRGRL